jgi:HK97 family phage major capsid protein
VKSELRKFEAFFELGEVRENSRTVEASISSEFPFEREKGAEVLVHTKEAIDLSRGPDFPLLLQHDRSQINVGIATNLRLVGRRLKATFRFGQSERSTDVWKDVTASILKFVSVAYHVIRKTSTDENGQYFVTKWMPYEVSIVSVAADSTVGINRSGNLQTTNKRIIKEMSKDEQREVQNYWTGIKQNQTNGEFFQTGAKRGIGGAQLEDEDVKRAAAGLSLVNDGLVAPEGFGEKVLFGRYASPLIKKILSLRVSENTIHLPYATSENRENGYFDSLQTYQVAEATDKTASKPTLAALQYRLKTTAILAYTTDELLQDSNLLDRFLTHTFSVQLAYDIERQLVTGTGHNEWLGIKTAPGRVRQAKEPGQTAGTLLAENVGAMWSRLLPECHSTAITLCSHTAFRSLMEMGLAVGTGGSVVNHLKFTPDGPTLMGRPLYVSPFCENTAGVEGDIIVFSPEFYLMVQRKEDPKQNVSMHLNYTLDESCYRLTLRSDGMPIQSKPTVYSAGGTGYSSIVTLKTRA